MMKLYSTLDKKVLEIVPIEEGKMTIYSCGPTVYFRMHIGNIRAYVNWDILHRALLYLGYDVKRVMNITDVGHMTSDENFGDDKMDKQALKEGVEPINIANKYIDTVLEDFRVLNILAPDGREIPEDLTHEKVEEYGWSRATNYVEQMIRIIQKIEKNGFTYETAQALYFDVSKLSDYNIFTGQNLEEKEIGVREEVNVDSEKKNPGDFVLWMKRVGTYRNHIMNWSSPWGDGFPGWHIECSAMGTAILGEKFDIHTGGIDHIPVHHTNERAQNIGAFGHGSVKYWIHNEWLVNKDDSKLSKSAGGASSLPEILELGFDPLDLRYLFASINYRTRMQFSMESLEGARSSRNALLRRIGELGSVIGKPREEYILKFRMELENNLNMSGIFALINELLKSQESSEDKLATIIEFDKVLGLGLGDIKKEVEYMDDKIADLLIRRQEAKKSKDYALSDKIREEAIALGYKILDTSEGQKVEKI